MAQPSSSLFSPVSLLLFYKIYCPGQSNSWMNHPSHQGHDDTLFKVLTQHWQFNTSVMRVLGLNLVFQIYFSLYFCS